jgi:hypothetical protein
MSNTTGFGQRKDGGFNSVWVKGCKVIDEEKNLKKINQAKMKSLLVRQDAEICGDITVKGSVLSPSSINVYHFGDSICDPGNTEFMPEPYATSGDPGYDAAFGLDFVIRSRNRISSDGQGWPYFVAKDMGLKYHKGFGLDNMSDKGNYVNFAIVGASQTQNLSTVFIPGYPSEIGSFIYQIDKLESLFNNTESTVNSISPDDIVMFDHGPGNDYAIPNLTEWVLPIPPGAGRDAYIAGQVALFATAAITNLTRLYDLGMRRVIINHNDVSFDQYNGATYMSANAYSAVIGGAETPLEVFTFQGQMRIDMLAAFKAALPAFLAARPDLDLIEMGYKDLIDNIVDNAGTNGLVLPFLSATPFVLSTHNTQGRNGGWPLPLLAPIKERNVFHIDDAHITQHTHRLMADLIKQWLNPLMPL